jgi:hypothetical protein
MLPNQVVTVLGFPVDAEQFVPFEFPAQCVLELSSIVDGSVVRARFASLPPPIAAARDGAGHEQWYAARLAVTFNYIKTCGVDATNERTTSAHMTWLALIEQLTRVSIASIADNGAFRVRAIPTHGVVLRGFEGQFSVTLATPGQHGSTAETRVGVAEPTMHAVLEACSALLGEPVRESYSVFGATTGRHVSEHENLLLQTSSGPFYVQKLVTRKTMQLVPLPACFKCGKLVGVLERSCATSARDHSVPKITMCNACGKLLRCATCGADHAGDEKARKKFCCGIKMPTADRTVCVWGMRLCVLPGTRAIVHPEAGVHIPCLPARKGSVVPEYASVWSHVAATGDDGLAQRALEARRGRTRLEHVAHYARAMVDKRAARPGAFAALPTNVIRLIFRHVYACIPMAPTTPTDVLFWRRFIDARLAEARSKAEP